MKRLLAGLLFLFTAFGCNQAPPPPPEDFTHQVTRSGETLAVIARWYTGNSANWEKILADNPGLDPSRMRQGTVVKIPRALIVRTEPLPASAVTARQVETHHEAPVPTQEEPKQEESYPDETDSVAAVVTPAPTVQPSASEPTAPAPTATPQQMAIDDKPVAAAVEKKVEDSAVSSESATVHVDAPAVTHEASSPAAEVPAPAAAANGAQ